MFTLMTLKIKNLDFCCKINLNHNQYYQNVTKVKKSDKIIKIERHKVKIKTESISDSIYKTFLLTLLTIKVKKNNSTTQYHSGLALDLSEPFLTQNPNPANTTTTPTTNKIRSQLIGFWARVLLSRMDPRGQTSSSSPLSQVQPPLLLQLHSKLIGSWNFPTGLDLLISSC